MLPLGFVLILLFEFSNATYRSLFIVLQVEYYFSDENLPTDKYMMNLIRKNKEGFGKYSAMYLCFQLLKHQTVCVENCLSNGM